MDIYKFKHSTRREGKPICCDECEREIKHLDLYYRLDFSRKKIQLCERCYFLTRLEINK